MMVEKYEFIYLFICFYLFFPFAEFHSSLTSPFIFVLFHLSLIAFLFLTHAIRVKPFYYSRNSFQSLIFLTLQFISFLTLLHAIRVMPFYYLRNSFHSLIFLTRAIHFISYSCSCNSCHAFLLLTQFISFLDFSYSCNSFHFLFLFMQFLSCLFITRAIHFIPYS